MKNRMLNAACALALMASPAVAETLTITSWTGEKHPFSEDYADFIERVEKTSDGRLKFELHVGGSLLPVKGVLEGIQHGVADIGNNIGAYTPADLPINNLLNDVAFAVSDDIAAAFAMTEITLLNPAVADEWSSKGVVFVNGWSTPVYYLACMEEIATPEDIQGKKIRTAGGTHVEWAKFIGGVPVSVPFSDVYSGLQRGSIDCVMMNPTDMAGGFQIAEVAKTYTLLPMGTHTSGVQYMFNKDRWASLSEEDRLFLIDELSRQLVRLQVKYRNSTGNGLDVAREKGISISDPQPWLTDALAEFKEGYFAGLPALTESKRGIPADQAEAVIVEFMAIYDKWAAFLAEADLDDEDALVEKVRAEIYNKLDKSSFGL